ncbi:protein of unknown function [Streptomyces sp. KY75]|nr:protein of unknown function [Streptomyces sp. KY75]CAD5987179.1 protein of unknown function [Streptomyces sp. KY70]
MLSPRPTLCRSLIPPSLRGVPFGVSVPCVLPERPIESVSLPVLTAGRPEYDPRIGSCPESPEDTDVTEEQCRRPPRSWSTATTPTSASR